MHTRTWASAEIKCSNWTSTPLAEWTLSGKFLKNHRLESAKHFQAWHHASASSFERVLPVRAHRPATIPWFPRPRFPRDWKLLGALFPLDRKMLGAFPPTRKYLGIPPLRPENVWGWCFRPRPENTWGWRFPQKAGDLPQKAWHFPPRPDNVSVWRCDRCSLVELLASAPYILHFPLEGHESLPHLLLLSLQRLPHLVLSQLHSYKKKSFYLHLLNKCACQFGSIQFWAILSSTNLAISSSCAAFTCFNLLCSIANLWENPIKAFCIKHLRGRNV